MPPVPFTGSSFSRFHTGKSVMIRLLEGNNIYSDLHVFEDAPNSFWLFHPWFQPTLQYTAEFLDKVFGKP